MTSPEHLEASGLEAIKKGDEFKRSEDPRIRAIGDEMNTSGVDLIKMAAKIELLNKLVAEAIARNAAEEAEGESWKTAS